MSSSRHIIRKLSLEVQLPGKYAATHQEQALKLVKTWLDMHFLPALEAALDEMEAHHASRQYLCFDRWDIDLGRLAPGDLSARSAPAMINGLHAAANHLTAAPATIKSPGQRVAEAFAFFLERGYLPWWHSSGKADADEWQEQIERGLSEPGPTAVLIVEALKKRTARQRLSALFGERFFLEVIVKQCFPAGAKQVSALWREWSAVLGQSILSSAKRSVLSSRLREWVLEWLSRSSLQKSSLREFVVRQLSESLSSHLPDDPTGGKTSDLPTLIATAFKKPLSAQQPELSYQESMPDAAAYGEDDTTIYIANAGIILLHPFLQMFFEALNISQSDVLRRPDKAVHLLHYLSTGNSKAEEHVLVLSKILCGLAPETYIHPSIRITRKEQRECKQLLEAVVRNWPALKNTSPKGLQHNYLCREGALSLRPDGGWFLKVSTNTIDILLDQLPWSISWVKLPWMKDMLQVEWS